MVCLLLVLLTAHDCCILVYDHRTPCANVSNKTCTELCAMSCRTSSNVPFNLGAMKTFLFRLLRSKSRIWRPKRPNQKKLSRSEGQRSTGATFSCRPQKTITRNLTQNRHHRRCHPLSLLERKKLSFQAKKTKARRVFYHHTGSGSSDHSFGIYKVPYLNPREQSKRNCQNKTNT